MLWYGYVYYIIFNFFVVMSILYTLKIFLIMSISRTNTILILNKSFLYYTNFILLVGLLVLNQSINYYQDIVLVTGAGQGLDLNYIGFFSYDSYVPYTSLNINLSMVYYYPFIYVFLIITVLSILFCLSYNSDELISFILYCKVILMSGYTLFFTDSIILFFMAYEMLLIPSFFILYKFAKTRRCVESAYLMFFWTQFGALFLIFGFIYIFLVSDSSTFSVISNTVFTSFEVNFIFLCCIIGFGVKLPLWPFYGWLPKAHVEASTNFSIFLSGVLVKFAFFGLMKCLISVQLEPTFIYIYPFLVVGMVDAVFKLFYQVDLKKLVAYSTVVEMHWLTICVVSGQSNLILANFCMLISHALISTNSFLLVDAISRRFRTRMVTEISGINFLCPKLFLALLLNILIFLGFPGSIFFISEFLFFSFLFDLFPVMCVFLIVLLYLIAPTFFLRTWINTMFGKSLYLTGCTPLDLSSRESIIFLGVPYLMYWLGYSWQSFVI